MPNHDVFIAAASTDEPWIRAELLPILARAGLSYQLESELPLGRPDVLNYEEALLGARKTLVILTPEWLESRWADFQTVLLATNDPAAREARLLPILLRPCELPPRLKMLTKLDMTDPDAYTRQWERLLKAMPPLFISYSREDKEFTLKLIADLRERGVTIWVDEQGLHAGADDWEQAIRDAIRTSRGVVYVASSHARRSRFVKAELEIAEMYAAAVYPIWAEGADWRECAPMGMIAAQYEDMRGDRYAAGLARLINAVGKAQSSTAAQVTHEPSLQKKVAAPSEGETQPPTDVPSSTDAAVINPYKALFAFTAEDAANFFGRDDLIAQLSVRAEAADSRLIAVIGASGSGKSSVVMAGLLPQLQKAHPDWLFLPRIVPGGHPIEALQIALQAATNAAFADLRKDLDDPDGRGLHLRAQSLARVPNARVVLFIDQFEELFTLTLKESERKQFIELLVNAANEPRSSLLILLTLRADFYDRPLNYAALGKLIETNSISILPMTVENLRAVIEKPAQNAAVSFEDNLVGDLLYEVRDEAGALPLLQFTLYQLFDQRDGRRLTRAAYQNIGGVRGALAQHAEATYTALPSDEHRKLARALFLRLIEPGLSDQDTTRRRIHRSEMNIAHDDEALMLATADAFINARLLTADKDTLEVSHEALIRHWERLKGWLLTSREDILLQKAIAADTSEWLRRGKRPEELYRGEKLAEAWAWARRNLPSRDEQAFLEAGKHAEEAAAAAENERRVNELRLARRAVAYSRVLVAILVASTLIFIFLTLFAVQSQQSEANARATVEMNAAILGRQATLAAGGAIPPPSDFQRPPDLLLPTFTAAAQKWTPQEQDFDGVTMVLVPAGCFYMGSVYQADEQPVHEQCFEQSFWIDKYEVTNAQFTKFGGVAAQSSQQAMPDHPRENITWFEARDFCAKRGARLSTEAEWEYAARGWDSLVYPWGNAFIADNVVYSGNSGGGSAAVGSRPAGVSWVGAMDMSGNVWEWVSSPYQPYPYQVNAGQEAISSIQDSRVLRGGSWFNADYSLRAAYRNWYAPGDVVNNAGIRCLLSAFVN
ncbi:MAG: hypothetical protein OHK0023_16510 [Anaerolineae bacterium]